MLGTAATAARLKQQTSCTKSVSFTLVTDVSKHEIIMSFSGDDTAIATSVGTHQVILVMTLKLSESVSAAACKEPLQTGSRFPYQF